MCLVEDLHRIAIGLAKGGALSVLRSFAAYWLTMLAAASFVLGCILSVPGISAQLLPRQSFLRVSGVFQMGAFCVILAAYFLRPSLVIPVAIADPANLAVPTWLPLCWFLDLFQQLNGSPHDLLAGQAVAPGKPSLLSAA